MNQIEHHRARLIENKLGKIENRLKRLELLFLKNLSSSKKINREMMLLEKEERTIEKEQQKLEIEEKEILREMGKIEKEELWNIEVRYNCRYKIMGTDNVITCQKTKKLCEATLCPLWKNR